MSECEAFGNIKKINVKPQKRILFKISWVSSFFLKHCTRINYFLLSLFSLLSAYSTQRKISRKFLIVKKSREWNLFSVFTKSNDSLNIILKINVRERVCNEHLFIFMAFIELENLDLYHPIHIKRKKKNYTAFMISKVFIYDFVFRYKNAFLKNIVKFYTTIVKCLFYSFLLYYTYAVSMVVIFESFF